MSSLSTFTFTPFGDFFFHVSTLAQTAVSIYLEFSVVVKKIIHQSFFFFTLFFTIYFCLFESGQIH